MNISRFISFNDAKTRKRAVGVIFMAIVLLLIILVSDPRPQQPTTDTDVPGESPAVVQDYESPNAWNGIKPGTHKITDVANFFGTEIRDDYQGDGKTKYLYDYYGKGGHPMEVITDYVGTIEYMRVPLNETKVGSLDTYRESLKLGVADMELYKMGEPEGIKVYVFLEEGVAFEANQYVRETYAIRFFVPTDKDTFLRLYGRDLSENIEDASKF